MDLSAVNMSPASLLSLFVNEVIETGVVTGDVLCFRYKNTETSLLLQFGCRLLRSSKITCHNQIHYSDLFIQPIRHSKAFSLPQNPILNCTTFVILYFSHNSLPLRQSFYIMIGRLALIFKFLCQLVLISEILMFVWVFGCIWIVDEGVSQESLIYDHNLVECVLALNDIITH